MRAIIEHLHKKGLNRKEIHSEMVEVWRDEAPAYSTVAKWVAEFKRGRDSLEDAPRSGRPRTSTDEETIHRIEDLVLTDRRVKMHQLAQMVGISKGSINSILHDKLNMNKVSARWVPKMLTAFDKRNRLESSTELVGLYDRNPEDFMNRIVTGDESWCYYYDPATKQESQHWKHPGSPTPIKFKKVKSAGKVMGIFFWDAAGVLLIEYVPPHQTVTGAYYSEVLGRLHAGIREKRIGKLHDQVLLLQDNAPPHRSHVALEAAAQNNFRILHHPLIRQTWPPLTFICFDI